VNAETRLTKDMKENPELFDLQPPEVPNLTIAVIAAWKGCCLGNSQIFPQRPGGEPSDCGMGELSGSGSKERIAMNPAALVDINEVGLLRAN
jgi:hypothetical protein